MSGPRLKVGQTKADRLLSAKQDLHLKLRLKGPDPAAQVPVKLIRVFTRLRVNSENAPKARLAAQNLRPGLLPPYGGLDHEMPRTEQVRRPVEPVVQPFLNVLIRLRGHGAVLLLKGVYPDEEPDGVGPPVKDRTV